MSSGPPSLSELRLWDLGNGNKLYWASAITLASSRNNLSPIHGSRGYQLKITNEINSCQNGTDWWDLMTDKWPEQSKLVLAAHVAMVTCAGLMHNGEKNAISPLSVGSVKTSRARSERD